MADVLGEVGGELFQYNREGWKFGAELRQRDLYQRQKMRIKQVDLYRDDIRELFDLTVGKMDKYIIVCLVMLSITMEMFFKGRNPVGTPSWIFWCWSICTAGAMLYLLMSIWLALHASISAQTFSVRCLTQWLRLPIPSTSEIAKGAAKLEEYEKTGADSLLRVPVLGKASEKATGLEGTQVQHSGQEDLTTAWQLFTSHFELFNRLHRKWQGYEAYSRVCMCLGLNHFLGAMSYFSLAVYALDLLSPWAGWAFVAIFQSSAVIHARLNLTLTFAETAVMVALVMIPSLFLSIAVAVTMTAPGVGGINETKYELAPCLFACVGILGHIVWIIFFLSKTKSDINGLPIKFSTVWCIDVLGFGMETLREVQEPVGKPTYVSRLPGYSKEGPKNQFDLGDDDEPYAGNSVIVDLVPETEESVKRSQLPWSVFKIGSAFTVGLWVLAFAQTIVLPFGVDTGIGQVSTRRLLDFSVDAPSITRGFLRDDHGLVYATEDGLVDGKSGNPISCRLAEGSVIRGLSGSVRRPYVLTGSTGSIVSCVTGKILDSPFDVRINAIAVHEDDVFGLIDSALKFFDSTSKRWITISGSEGRYGSNCSMGINQDGELVVMRFRNQTIDRWNSQTGDLMEMDVVLPHSEDIVWGHTDGNSLIGISKKDRSRVFTVI
ncbi:hypothetical protein C9890_0188 [Perkinsus sp. BL_2016]|nr:hypothetical protein C9890_0188 [Perkinsus sp. BL_2016]